MGLKYAVAGSVKKGIQAWKGIYRDEHYNKDLGPIPLATYELFGNKQIHEPLEA